jgi:hypothetical protein
MKALELDKPSPEVTGLFEQAKSEDLVVRFPDGSEFMLTAIDDFGRAERPYRSQPAPCRNPLSQNGHCHGRGERQRFAHRDAGPCGSRQWLARGLGLMSDRSLSNCPGAMPAAILLASPGFERSAGSSAQVRLSTALTALSCMVRISIPAAILNLVVNMDFIAPVRVGVSAAAE